MTNLAKVQSAKGLKTESESTLWQALELDPNQENGLLWWAAIQKERDGDDAFLQAMRTTAALPGSWRPQLWLARQCLKEGNLAEARKYYLDILDRAANQQDVLMMISGDLGQAGYLSEILELVLPNYDPEQHDVRAGFNLVQACIDLKNWSKGDGLLHRMMKLNRPDLKETFFRYSAELDKLRNAEDQVEQPSVVDATLFPVERPVWTYGLKDATWLVTPKPQGDCVVFVPLAIPMPSDVEEPTARKEDDLGRFSRSLPLYLMESLHFWSPFATRLALPVVRGGGPVVVGRQWANDQLLSMAGDAKFAVSGSITKTEEDQTWIELRIWDCHDQQVSKNLQWRTTDAELAETLLRIEQELLTTLAGSDVRSSPLATFYKRPDAKTIESYLSSLGQSLMLSLVQNELVSKDSVWGERNILQFCLAVALQLADSQVPKILFLGAIAKCHDYGSSVWEEFRRESLQMIADEKDETSCVYRLSPLLLTFLDPELFHLRRAALLKHAAGEYRSWLESLSVAS